jgi:SAM-dependent methyltransferase
MTKKLIVWLIWQLRRVVGFLNLPSRLVKWTGKSPYAIHPKYLLDSQSQYWYLQHLDRQDIVLDVGCGNAMHTVACAARCRETYGFDYDSRQLQIGQAAAKDRGLDNVHLQTGNAEEQWDFPDTYFDKVLLLDVLEHLNRRDFVLQEARRVLKDNGRLILSVPNRETLWKRLRREAGLFAYADEDHKVEYTQEEIGQELARSGFICDSVAPIVYDTPWDWAINVIGGISLKWYSELQEWKRNMAIHKPEESTGFRIVAHVTTQNEALK